MPGLLDNDHAWQPVIDDLSTLLLERQRQIPAQANDDRQSRIIRGMHCLPDIGVGRRSGTVLAVFLLQQADYPHRPSGGLCGAS